MRSRTSVAAVASCFTLVAACCSCSSTEGTGSGFATQNRQLVLTGSSTVAPLAAELAKRYESLHPGVRIDVQSGGSSRGIADTRRRLADLGMVSRALKPGESDLLAFSIARDGICIIVHRDNPVHELSGQQLRAIYTGKIDSWQAVGGADQPVTVVNKAEGRSTLELFLDYFDLESPDVQADVVIGDNEQGIKTVAGNPHAIGYVSIGAAEYDAEQGVPIKLLPVGGVDASVANVRNGSFPLSRPLNLVTGSQPQGLAQKFIEFARSEQVHEIVEEQYFVPVVQ